MAYEKTHEAARSLGMPLKGLRPIAPASAPEDVVKLAPRGMSIRTGDHAAVIYWSKDELLRTIVPYLVEGLRAGDKVVYVADDLTVAEVGEALQRAGIPVGAETSAGHLVLTSAAEAFFPKGHFDIDGALSAVNGLAQGAIQAGFKRVRFSVEMTYLQARVPGIERGPEFESRANEEVFARLPFVCICSFNGAHDISDTLADVLRTHPVLIEEGAPMANPYYRAWSQLRLDPAAVDRWTAREEKLADAASKAG